ncbi:MAG: MerR family transcriptional regulator [Defluviitaleaceae bacterium]|nr:MerR family transcriptional regulator [Defluviitaleaceae bacterium]
MEMANCRKCKKIFPMIKEPLCDSCLKEEEKLFLSVRDFLQDSPKSTLAEVSAATNVSAKKILGYLREGRIEIISGELKCRFCGVAITSGNCCDACIIEMNQQIDEMGKKTLPTRHNATMHTMQNNNNNNKR